MSINGPILYNNITSDCLKIPLHPRYKEALKNFSILDQPTTIPISSLVETAIERIVQRTFIAINFALHQQSFHPSLDLETISCHIVQYLDKKHEKDTPMLMQQASDCEKTFFKYVLECFSVKRLDRDQLKNIVLLFSISKIHWFTPHWLRISAIKQQLDKVREQHINLIAKYALEIPNNSLLEIGLTSSERLLEEKSAILKTLERTVCNCILNMDTIQAEKKAAETVLTLKKLTKISPVTTEKKKSEKNGEGGIRTHGT